MYISHGVEGPVLAVRRPVASFAHERLPRPIQNTKADPSSRDQTTAPQQTWNAQFSVSVYSPGRARHQAAGSCQARPYLPGARRVRPFPGRELTGLSRRGGIRSVSSSGIADD